MVRFFIDSALAETFRAPNKLPPSVNSFLRTPPVRWTLPNTKFYFIEQRIKAYRILLCTMGNDVCVSARSKAKEETINVKELYRDGECFVRPNTRRKKRKYKGPRQPMKRDAKQPYKLPKMHVESKGSVRSYTGRRAKTNPGPLQ